MMHGKIAMTTFRDNLDKELLLEILEEDSLPAANYCYLDGWFLQMDNDPKNTSKLIKDFVYNNVPSVLNWPSKSPGPNPIENVWKVLKQSIRKRPPKSLDELEDIIHEEWRNFSDEKIMHICETFLNGIDLCIEKNGKRLRY